MRHCMKLSRVDDNERWRKKNRRFWNVVLAKGINDFLGTTSDKRKSVSHDKCKKVNTDGDREEKNKADRMSHKK